jgi:ribosomal-protein-alanine N-acetyltransferase
MNGRTKLTNKARYVPIRIKIGFFYGKDAIFLSKPYHIQLLREEHAPLLLDYCVRNRHFLAPYEPLRDASYYQLDHQVQVVRQAMQSCEKDLGYAFGIFEMEDKKLIGRINVSNVSRTVFQNATLGYSTDYAYNGRGWTTEAVLWVTRFAFSSLLLHRIQAGVMPRNIASIRVLEKSGYRREGLAQRYLKINDRWEDHLIFATTLEEWEDKIL